MFDRRHASRKNQTEDSGPNGRNLRSTVDPVGSIRLILSTLMSAFASSGQVVSWLSFKHLLQALAGKAGGTAVMTTVDHTLMRGSEPHDRWYVAELPRSSDQRRIGDPADSGYEGSPDRGRAPGLARQ